MTELRIVCAAIMDHDGHVYSVARPGRHSDVIRLMVDRGCTKPVNGPQGFLTNEGRFVGRETALTIALAAGQLQMNDKVGHQGDLFSEDLW